MSDNGNSKTDRLATLKAKKAAIDAQIYRLNTETAAEQRKRHTRRKILIGSVILEEAERHPKFAKWLHSQLSRGLKQPRDRILFNLLPLPTSNTETVVDQTEDVTEINKRS